MKAVICTKYGSPDVLEFRDVDQPVPKENEVRIKIYATSVHIGDTKIRRLEPGMGNFTDILVKPIMRVMLGFRAPRQNILGMEFAGKIDSIGNHVTKFKVGDSVFGATGMGFGAYAEYKCLSEDEILAPMPSNMSFDEAATVPNGALTALMLLQKANIKPEQTVLIYGASGSVGTFSVQLAKFLGAIVTGVCSTDNQDMVKLLGAEQVIDYTQQDISKIVEKYDVIFDAVGKLSRAQVKKIIKKNGTYLNVLSITNSMTLKVKDLVFIKKMVETDHLVSVIDRHYSLDQMVEAHRYVDKGHKKGNVAVTIIPNDSL